MNWTYETALSVDECLKLIHDTKNAYESFRVSKHGYEFRVWQEKGLLEYSDRTRTIDQILDGVLERKATGTRIHLSIGMGAESANWLLLIAPLLLLIPGMCGVILFSSLANKPEIGASACLGSCFAVILGLVALVYYNSRLSTTMPAERDNLVAFVAHVLQAKPTTEKTFGRPQIVMGKSK